MKKAVSWVLAGVFAYAWWWVGHRWSYLHVAGNTWTSVYELFALMSLMVLLRARNAAGSGLFGGLVGVLRGFAPNLVWLVVAVIVLRVAAWVQSGVADPIDNFVHAAVTALAAGVLTALVFGAIANADDS